MPEAGFSDARYIYTYFCQMTFQTRKWPHVSVGNCVTREITHMSLDFEMRAFLDAKTVPLMKIVEKSEGLFQDPLKH